MAGTDRREDVKRMGLGIYHPGVMLVSPSCFTIILITPRFS
jgi:hypothetical protein